MIARRPGEQPVSVWEACQQGMVLSLSRAQILVMGERKAGRTEIRAWKQNEGVDIGDGGLEISLLLLALQLQAIISLLAYLNKKYTMKGAF